MTDKDEIRNIIELFIAWNGEAEPIEVANIDSAVEFIGSSLQKEPVIEDLGDYINELSKQFPEVSFAKLSRIAVRVAKWQKQQDQSTIELAEDHAMLAGMEKMKEEMMAKAIDAKLLEGHLIRQKGVTHPLHVGDKVKVIVIKED